MVDRNRRKTGVTGVYRTLSTVGLVRELWGLSSVLLFNPMYLELVCVHDVTGTDKSSHRK